MKTLLFVVVSFMVLGGFTEVSSRTFPLEVADPLRVRECRLVEKIPGPYGYRFWGPPPVLGDFRYRSAVKAKEAGATHIFWRETINGYYGQTRVVGYAFDCKGVVMPKYYDDTERY